MAVTDVGSWDFGSAGVKEVRTSLDVSLGISDAKRHLCMHIRMDIRMDIGRRHS